MYNGIGLPTARGSGTNGYVQKNQSYIRPRSYQQQSSHSGGTEAKGLGQRTANVEILKHEKRREVEVRCEELKEMLSNRGNMAQEDIDREVDKLRQELLADLDKVVKAKEEYTISTKIYA